MDRHQLERKAVALFGIAAIVEAIVCSAVIISGWFAGVMEDHAERVFWAGAILSFIMVAVFAAAALPGGSNDPAEVRRISWLLRVGIVLFIAAPALCIGAMIADFYG
jgi:hypothetical protein